VSDDRSDRHRDAEGIGRQVERSERRKLRARQSPDRSVWFWLGMMGIVGWSVAVPTLIGLALGVWVDRHWPSRVSATLTGLVLGAAVGSAVAWFWVKRESGET